ncbi:MAG: DNA polymerase/3'-5' exonuclease PolX [Chloroflexi bacterium]|nr:DNA polymerase/3'-5' exonuclease PolX [Chloroflexota bacterium]
MTNADAAALLEEYADLLELRGESVHRRNAYRRAASGLRETPTPLAELVAEHRLRQVPGVGEAIAAKLSEVAATGSFHQLDEVREQIPPSLSELLEVPDVGARTAMRLYQELGIADLSALEAAARAGKLRHLAGFGARSEERLLQGIAQVRQRGTRMALGEALPLAERLLADLRATAPIDRVELAGSLRRMKDTIGDIDLLCAATDPPAVIDAFAELPTVARVLWRGNAKCTVVTGAGVQVDLEVLPPPAFGSLLIHFTGSREHNIRLRTMAQDRGWSLSEHGLIRDGVLEPLATEAEVYAALGLDWTPPELREDRGEIEAAAEHRLPALVELTDLRGELHCHSNWSDGGASIEAMALAARDAGREYLVITDHSHGLAVANGLDVARLRQQRTEIEAARQRVEGITILHGCEMEIHADGSLDLDDETLGWLDLVIASLHVSLRQPRPVITERLLRAIRHPLVDIIAHPTGRIVNRRPGADLAMDDIIATAAATGTILEINADPARLDLTDYHARAAIQAGVLLSIDTDAHSPSGFGLARYGVAQARRGWVTRDDVANCLAWPDLRARLKRHRH